MRNPILTLALCCATALSAAPVRAQDGAKPYKDKNDWLTFAHDPGRSGWAMEETAITPQNVAGLELKWKTSVKNEQKALAALTAPLVATSIVTTKGVKTVVYVGGSSDNLHAIDAETGALLWSREFQPATAPVKKDQWLCPNNLNATPVIDKRTNTIYVIRADGKLEGCDLSTGATKFGPTQFVPAYSKNWSLNLVDGVIYTSLSQGCGGGQSGLYAMDVRDPFAPKAYSLLVNSRGGGGIWGRGGPVIGNGRVYGATGDGDFNPAKGFYGSTIVAAGLAPNFKLMDYYAPRNWAQINLYDWDLGCTSPVWFSWKNRNLLALGAKEGVVYLNDADDLGNKDHQTPLFITPRLGNDEDSFEGKGVWGAPSAYVDLDGEAWVYVPVWGPMSAKAPKFPLTNGENPAGSLMAFKVAEDERTGRLSLAPAWVSGNLNVPDPPVIAGGVVFVLSTGENVAQTVQGGIIFKNKLTLLTNADREGKTQNAVLYALDAKTGRVLYQSGKDIESWVHFSGLAVANGRVFVVDRKSNVYSFGLREPKEKASK